MSAAVGAVVISRVWRLITWTSDTRGLPRTTSTAVGRYCSSVVLHGGSSCLRSMRTGAYLATRRWAAVGGAAAAWDGRAAAAARTSASATATHASRPCCITTIAAHARARSYRRDERLRASGRRAPGHDGDAAER